MEENWLRVQYLMVFSFLLKYQKAFKPITWLLLLKLRIIDLIFDSSNTIKKFTLSMAYNLTRSSFQVDRIL